MSEKINPACPCSSKGCSRHGNCKACLDYHRRVGSPTCCGKTSEEDEAEER
ncbi:MAG: hypothetical protein LBU88_03195 [Treponema sp.]|jgi:hypothetical protein|nr:hypothetical protein [Treponema sp.]